MSAVDPTHHRWEQAYLWPIVESRLFLAAVGRSWRRILVGAAAGWLVSVVVGAIALAFLEVAGVISRSLSDSLGIAIVLGGTAAGALVAYAVRPRDRETEPAPHASTRPPRARAVPRPRGTGEAPPRRRRPRAARR